MCTISRYKIDQFQRRVKVPRRSVLRARTSFALMSDICSENDCRNPLEGERGELGPSTDMPGEVRAREKREKNIPHTIRRWG